MVLLLSTIMNIKEKGQPVSSPAVIALSAGDVELIILVYYFYFLFCSI